MTLVSGYWSVTGRYTDEMYHTWFKKTMKINQRMYFFCERETIPLIQSYRGDLETIFVECTIDDFYSNTRYNPDWVNVYDIPSVELGKIYHEKINLMKRAKDMDGEERDRFLCLVRRWQLFVQKRTSSHAETELIEPIHPMP